MDVELIKGSDTLYTWLEDKPVDWGQIIAVRAALRVFPILDFANERWLRQFTLLSVRAIAISWAARNIPAHDMAARAAAADVRAASTSVAATASAYASAAAARAAYTSADAAARAAYAAAFAADAAAHAAYAAAADADAARAAFWFSIQRDCRWLVDTTDSQSVARVMTERRLWQGQPPETMRKHWEALAANLLAIDPNYSVWIEWYERRIRGERAAFDIPGDKRRVEDKKILIRLAEATDEDFWRKGHEYVNATLKGWLEEARARVAPPPLPQPDDAIALPPQEAGAVAYGINREGRIDRLPLSDQARLRDTPEQRRSYAILRLAALDLREEGQRLGDRLKRVLDRFINALPKRFEDAETDPIWSHATALRSLNYAHNQAAKPPEPDDARLDGVVAAYLDGLLKHYNVFAFGDDGLRAKDEKSISAQERAKAVETLKVGLPVSAAMQDNPQILSDGALADLEAIEQARDLPKAEPYDGQILDDANRSTSNMVAALLSDGWTAFKNANPVVQGLGINAAWDGIKLVATFVGGVEYGPILNFIATYASILHDYVVVVYPHYEHLPTLIAQIKAVWERVNLKF